MKIEIKTFSLEHVLENDRILFNVNNLYEKQPADYWDRFYTEDWAHLFHNNKYHTITLTEKDLEWMKEANKVNMLTNRFSEIYNDDLETTCKKYENEMNRILKYGDKWFIRTEDYSLKYALHGVGPYNSLKKILQSVTTYATGHSCIKDTDKTKTIYFFPWIDMDWDKEFRVFVYNNKITAISQQHLYSVNKWLLNKTDDEIKDIVVKIVKYFNSNISDKLGFIKDYVMDLSLIEEDETPYFIEPNKFGKEYGSGSSLFHWETDHDDLHESNTIQFRFVNKD